MEALAAAALETTRPGRCRGRLPSSMRIRLTAALHIKGMAAMALAAARWWRTGRRCRGTCFIGKFADLLDIVGVMGLEGMMGGKGATGQFPDALTLHCAAVNMTYMVIGMAGITCVKGPLRVRRTHCGLLHLAHCQGLLHRLMMTFKGMMVPYVWMRLAPR